MLYIFDMGGVVTTNADLENRISQVLGISREDFLKYAGMKADGNMMSEDSINLFSLATNGIIDTKQFWTIFTKRSGIAVKTDWWHWLFHPVRNEKTIKIIESLKKEGNRVVCGTNTISAHYFNHMERGDYEVFDQTYSSCAMGISKPDGDFWNVIMEAENVQPKDTVFIDDKEENCLAAQKLGIHAIHFTSAEDLASTLGVML